MVGNRLDKSAVVMGAIGALLCIGLVVVIGVSRGPSSGTREEGPNLSPDEAMPPGPTAPILNPFDGSTRGDDPAGTALKNAKRTGRESPERVLNGFAQNLISVNLDSVDPESPWIRRVSRWATTEVLDIYEVVGEENLASADLRSLEVQSHTSESLRAVIRYHGIDPVEVEMRNIDGAWWVSKAEPAP